MRRGIGLAVSLGVVAISCTQGVDDTPGPTATAPVAAESPGETTEPRVDATELGGDTAVTPQPASGDQGIEVVELPGLIDTTDEEIPNDPGVRAGVLDNGLRYYVRDNDNPGSKATLRLAIKAGSVDELTDATGLAHFAEHMLFNGTAEYPENRLIDVLRGFGADFGPDINAYTSFDETVYKLVVPSDDDSVALGIDVLEEWLSNATIADDEVVKERGVVLDEWRVRTQTTQGRLFEVAQGLFLDGSAYDGRSPIGSAESISQMQTADLRAFYDAWYRPDNAAVIVVGDIAADDVVRDIDVAFGSAVQRTDAPPGRPDVAFGVDTEADFGLHLDPDQQTVDVEVSLPIPADTGSGTAAARLSLIDSMIYESLVRRLDEDRAAGAAPFDQIVRGGNSFVDTLDAPALFAFTDAERVTETLTSLLDEYERAFEFGFTAAETDLARATLQSFFDTRFDGRNSRQDTDIADALVESFLTGAPYPNIAAEYDVLTDELAAITPAALDQRFRARWTNSAPHVVISAPEAVADRMPDRDEVLALVSERAARDATPRDELRELPAALMVRPEPIAPTSRERVLGDPIPIYDPIEVRFPNGVRVVLTTNTIAEGQVYLQAVSPGGSSQVDDGDVIDAIYSPDVVTGGGVAGFNQAELARINADVDVSVSALISPYADRFAGQAATSDLEVLMQMVHLYFTAPRFDQVALERVRSFERSVIDDPASDPARVADDALNDVRYADEIRYVSLPTPEQFDTLDLEGIERVWRDRHADAGDWTFAFAGDVDPDELIDLASSYLATLPATGAQEGWIDLGLEPSTEPIVVARRAGTGDTATVTLQFTTPASGDVTVDGVEADIAGEVLSARLTSVVREQLGDSYSPFVTSFLTGDPTPVVQTFSRISGSPDRVDAIADVVLAEFADLAQGGMTTDEFDRAFSLVAERYNFVNNGLFLSALTDAALVPGFRASAVIDRFDLVGEVSPDDITAFIADHLPLDRYVQVVVVPR